MKIKQPLILLLAALPTFTYAVEDESSPTQNLSYIPFVNLGYQKMNIDSDFGGVGVTKPIYTLGLGVGSEDIAFSASYTSTYGDDADNINDAMGEVEPIRREFDFSVSVPINEHFSFFTGYLRSDTELSSDSVAPIFGINGNYTQTVKENGLYAGAVYKYRLGSGQLSASLAYASQQMELDDNSEVFAISSEGTTKGVSLGLKWTSLITHKLGYTVSLNSKRYKTDSNTEFNRATAALAFPEANSDSLDGDWFTTTLSTGLLYIF